MFAPQFLDFQSRVGIMKKVWSLVDSSLMAGPAHFWRKRFLILKNVESSARMSFFYQVCFSIITVKGTLPH